MSDEMHKGTLILPKKDYIALKHRATDLGVSIQELIILAVHSLLAGDSATKGDAKGAETGVASEHRGTPVGLSKQEAEKVITALRKQADDLESALGNRPSGGAGSPRGKKTA